VKITVKQCGGAHFKAIPLWYLSHVYHLFVFIVSATVLNKIVCNVLKCVIIFVYLITDNILGKNC